MTDQRDAKSSDLSVRTMRPTDLPFVYNSWLKSYKTRSQFARRITDEVFYRWHKLVVERILGRAGTQVLVATPKDDADTILGYLVVENQEVPVAHFAYVKTSFRRLGIARALLDRAGLDPAYSEFTHWTRDMDWVTEKLKTFKYNPYRL